MKRFSMSAIPGFVLILSELNKGNADVAMTLGRHAHWGMWKQPQNPDCSSSGYAEAAEQLTRLIIQMAEIRDGMSVLDIGCGFGGTIGYLNQHFSKLKLVGVNIDENQLRQAQKTIQASNDNHIEWICADACSMPLADASFDVVLAVESIFFFPSRVRFFEEAKKLLKPSGKLILSDFVLPKRVPYLDFVSRFYEKVIEITYGKSTHFTVQDYREVEAKFDFVSLEEKDITQETLPTYRALYRLLKTMNFVPAAAYISTFFIEIAHRLKQFQYIVFAYQKR